MLGSLVVTPRMPSLAPKPSAEAKSYLGRGMQIIPTLSAISHSGNASLVWLVAQVRFVKDARESEFADKKDHDAQRDVGGRQREREAACQQRK